MLLEIARASLLNRKFTVLLTVLSIAVSVILLLGIEHLRNEARTSFSKTVSGVDLIVGARSSPLNLLLYSVFRMGNATSNLRWQTFQQIRQWPEVAWAIPISLGDSHRGFRVMGTSTDYFTHFRYGEKQPLTLAEGTVFHHPFEAVLGAEVALALGYRPGDRLVLTHGITATHFNQHNDNPFVVSGILEPTGTPVDQTVHVSLAGIEAIHADWQNGVHLPGSGRPDLTREPRTLTAFMVGLNSRMATFAVQRKINALETEPLLAILPGVALSELWQMLGTLEKILGLIAGLALVSALLGMTTLLLASMRERQREMAILRAIGAHATFIFLLVELEALLITLLGCALGTGLLTAGLHLAQDSLSHHYGLFIGALPFTLHSLWLLGGTLLLAAVLALLPALHAYRLSLTQGLGPRT